MPSTDVEVHLEWRGRRRPVGTMRRHSGRSAERITFHYADEWIASPHGFAIDPSLPVGPGTFRPADGHAMFGAIGDTAPDSWGRALMRRRERRRAAREGRAVRTVQETEFLLGVADEARMGALRFRRAGDEVFQAPPETATPGLIALGRLRHAADRVLDGTETDEELRTIFAPGSSLGGARPKASVVDRHGQLAIAKFPKQNDEYSLERWEAIALDLANAAGIRAAAHELEDDRGRPIFISRRFDRTGGRRVPSCRRCR